MKKSWLRQLRNYIWFHFWDFRIDGALRLTRFLGAGYINQWQYERLLKWHKPK